LALDLQTRYEAVRLLKAGWTIFAFPAPKGFGKPVDLPWKVFSARLIQLRRPLAIPVHFAG
jgi:hypothetical protein